MNIRGAITAIVTPFDDGNVDETAFVNLINRQIEGGIDGIVAVGTTGESPTLTHEEHKRVIELCVETVDGRVPVIAGAGSNSTAEAVALTEFAAVSGANAALVVNPYYNKPGQEGLYQHFTAVAEVNFPVIVYNIPGRTAGKVTVDTMARLAEHENIIGVKDAVGDLAETSELIARLGPDFIVLSGDDALTLPMMALGGFGVVSVLANLVPDRVTAMVSAIDSGDYDTARSIHYEINPLARAMFIETNPVPVKTALSMMGLIKEEFRLPLCPMSQINCEKLRDVTSKAGLLNG